MGNLCGKQAFVEPADGQAAGSRQASTAPGTRAASKSQAEASGGSVKKQQQASEQQHKKVQWSIPAEPSGQEEQPTSTCAEQQSTAVNAAVEGVQP